MDSVFTNNVPSSLSGSLYSLGLQPDGKILLGGAFSIGKPTVWTNLARLNGAGTLDSNFLAGANSTGYSLAPQPDRPRFGGANLPVLNGQAPSRGGPINPSGSLAPNIKPTLT